MVNLPKPIYLYIYLGIGEGDTIILFSNGPMNFDSSGFMRIWAQMGCVPFESFFCFRRSPKGRDASSSNRFSILESSPEAHEHWQLKVHQDLGSNGAPPVWIAFLFWKVPQEPMNFDSSGFMRIWAQMGRVPFESFFCFGRSPKISRRRRPTSPYLLLITRHHISHIRNK